MLHGLDGTSPSVTAVAMTAWSNWYAWARAVGFLGSKLACHARTAWGVSDPSGIGPRRSSMWLV